MTDTNKLKELASKATPGPWWIDSHGHHMVSESQDHQTIFLTDDRMGPATRHPETGNLSHWPNDWDASYIAAANPQVILGLIERLERAEKDAARYRWLREQPNDCSEPRIDVVRWEPMDESANEGEGLRLEVLDAAIDAALEGGGR